MCLMSLFSMFFIDIVSWAFVTCQCAVIDCKLNQNAEGCNSCASFAWLVLSFIVYFIACFITVRRYALHGLCDRNSVCPSVCPSHSWTVSTWFDLRSWFLHRMVASSFCEYHVHHKIRRGSPRARALNEDGVGTNWRFSTNKPLYLRNGARYEKGYYWSLIGNRIRAFDWYQINDLGWPWNDLRQQLCTTLHYTHVFRSQPLKFAWR